MTTYLSKELQDGLDSARRQTPTARARLRLRHGDTVLPVRRHDPAGLWLDSTAAPRIRGLVDIYDGARHLYQALIVASREDGDLTRFEFKRSTRADAEAPVDFERAEAAPVALLGDALPE